MEAVIQLVLTLSLVSLTLIFLIVGFWVILVLREVKQLLVQLRAAATDLSETTGLAKEKIKEGLSLATLLTALSALWSQREKLEEKIFGDREKSPQKETKIEVKTIPPKTDQKEKTESEPKRRFFFRRKR